MGVSDSKTDYTDLFSIFNRRKKTPKSLINLGVWCHVAPCGALFWWTGVYRTSAGKSHEYSVLCFRLRGVLAKVLAVVSRLTACLSTRYRASKLPAPLPLRGFLGHGTRSDQAGKGTRDIRAGNLNPHPPKTHAHKNAVNSSVSGFGLSDFRGPAPVSSDTARPYPYSPLAQPELREIRGRGRRVFEFQEGPGVSLYLHPCKLQLRNCGTAEFEQRRGSPADRYCGMHCGHCGKLAALPSAGVRWRAGLRSG